MSEKEAVVAIFDDFNYSDGTMVVTLSYGQREFLKLIGTHGMGFNKDTWRENARTGVESMVEKGIIRETPLVGSGRCFYIASELGIQILSAMRALPSR